MEKHSHVRTRKQLSAPPFQPRAKAVTQAPTAAPATAYCHRRCASFSWNRATISASMASSPDMSEIQRWLLTTETILANPLPSSNESVHDGTDIRPCNANSTPRDRWMRDMHWCGRASLTDARSARRARARARTHRITYIAQTH